MGLARVGQFVDGVEVRGKGRGAVQPNVAVAVALNQGARIAGIGFEMQHARGLGIKARGES